MRKCSLYPLYSNLITGPTGLTGKMVKLPVILLNVGKLIKAKLISMIKKIKMCFFGDNSAYCLKQTLKQMGFERLMAQKRASPDGDQSAQIAFFVIEPASKYLL
jgi:hypothetical protein